MNNLSPITLYLIATLITVIGVLIVAVCLIVYRDFTSVKKDVKKSDEKFHTLLVSFEGISTKIEGFTNEFIGVGEDMKTISANAAESVEVLGKVVTMNTEEIHAGRGLIMDNQSAIIKQGMAQDKQGLVLESQGEDIKTLYTFHFETKESIAETKETINTLKTKNKLK